MVQSSPMPWLCILPGACTACQGVGCLSSLVLHVVFEALEAITRRREAWAMIDLWRCLF